MSPLRTFLLLAAFPILHAGELPQGFPETSRQKTSLNQNWRYHLGAVDGAEKPGFDDSGWENVHVPHTLKLTSLGLDDVQNDKSQETFHRYVGLYRRTLTIDEIGTDRLFLEFEGVHQVTDVWLNGQHLGQHSVGGYTPFHFDITDIAQAGENQLVVRADNTRRDDVPPDPGPFDYIKFSGLYRDVYLVRTSPVRITFNWEDQHAGVSITTPVVDPVNGNAVIDVKTGIQNHGDSKVKVELITRVIDDRGVVVLKMIDEKTVESRRSTQFDQIGAIEDNLRLWSPADPYLYRVNTMLAVDGKPVDVVENPLGVRKFEHDSERGFLLNNEPIELIGLNRHQHYGYIGDAVPDSLHYKDMLQFKQLGFNTVRTAHYPQDNALLEACDRLGILVYEEAPTWISMPSNPQWWKNFDSALRTMIRNHRNHPSVIIWGAGINHRGYVPSAVLACKQEDPTRLTASQSSRWTGWQTSGLTDIFANMMYGPGMWDRSEPLLAMEGNWDVGAFGPYFEDKQMTGLISWTAHAYYTFHPHKTTDESNRTRLGIMTVFREPKRELPAFPAELLPEPQLHIADPWSEETKTLEIYSNAEEVELMLNGEAFIKAKPSTDKSFKGLKHAPFRFVIEDFKPATLTANGLIDGKVVATATAKTPEKPAAIELLADADGREFHADGSDLMVLYARLIDANGTRILNTGTEVTFKVDGPGSIVGDGEDIAANPCITRDGTAPVLVRAGTVPGTITVTAEANGLKAGSVVLTTIPAITDITLANAKPIHDFDSLRVDLGAPDQLVQFDWFAWNSEDQKSSKIELPVFGGIKATLKPATDDGLLRWLGEMNVIGKYGFAYGEGAIGMDPEGIVLEFDGLPAGTYKLKTWHHAPNSNTNEMDPNLKNLGEETIHKLAYARRIEGTIGDSKTTTVISEGREAQTKPVATSTLTFQANGKEPVSVRFRDAGSKRGIWLNAFEISEWDSSLEEP